MASCGGQPKATPFRNTKSLRILQMQVAFSRWRRVVFG